MNKSQRIRTDIENNSDKHIKVKLEQDVSSLEILSLTIDQKDDFPFYNCDYGVLVGRAIANGGVGIPNAKISIFIPIDDDDKLREEIMAIYPYEKARDKNRDGKRYNLLPRVATTNKDNIVSPKQPFGSFPIKEEVVTNETWLEVYEKYYKYTTVTNNSGDYMLFGVPTGIQVVHMSVDITDIGRYSMTPATMVTNLGYSENLFTSDNRVKEKEDLDDLPHIETQEISVDVIPFCGDSDNFDIGITRQDFRLRAELLGTFTIFGSAFTNGDNQMYINSGDNLNDIKNLYRSYGNINHISTYRTAQVTEQFFYYPNSIDDSKFNEVDPETQIVAQDSNTYSSVKKNGDFLFIIPCNRKRMITDEFGNLIETSNDDSNGIFTEYKGFMTMEISTDELPMNFEIEINQGKGVFPLRYKYKFPQYSTTLGNTITSNDNDLTTLAWKKQYYTFSFGEIYSVAKFHPTSYNSSVYNDDERFNGFWNKNENGTPDKDYDDYNNQIKSNGSLVYTETYSVGAIYTNDRGEFLNTSKEFPSNLNDGSEFGGNWMNFSIYFMQNGRTRGNVSQFLNTKSNTNFLSNEDTSYHFIDSNTQIIAGGIINTQWFPRIDLHFTDFIEVPKQDINNIYTNITTKGFKSTDITLQGTDYKYGHSLVPEAGSGDNPLGSGKVETIPTNPLDDKRYFYRGLNESDCIKLIVDLGLT